MASKYYFKNEEDRQKWIKKYKSDLEYCFKLRKYCHETSKNQMYGQMIKDCFEKLNQLKNNKKYLVL